MRLFLCFLFALFMSTSSHGAAHTLQVLVTQFPPFVDIDAEDGGIAWSALSDFASEKGVRVTPIYRPTARILTQVENDNWHASLVSIPISTNVVTIGYSDYEVSYGVFTKDPSISGLSNLEVAAIRTNSRSGFQEQIRKAGAVIIEVDSLDQGYRMVRAGRVDAVLSVGIDGVAVGATDPESLHLTVQLAVLPFTLFVNMNTSQGREAARLLTD